MDTLSHFQNILLPTSVVSGVRMPLLKHSTMPRSNRRCQNCGATETPQWRIGTGGVTLCNKCGLKHQKVAKKIIKKSPSSYKHSIKFLLN